MTRDPFTRWINEHPRTMAYIAAVVTGEFILALVEHL